jgi:hypothetical protein
VSAPEAGAPVATHRVDLVDEDDAGRVGLPLFEEVTDAGGADADEHLDEVGPRHLEEGATGLAGHGLRQQRLSGSGRPDEEHTLGKPPAQAPEKLRVLQELDDLREFLLGLVGPCHVVEGDLRRVRRDELGLGAPELERLVPAALHAPEHPEPEDDEDDPRKHEDEVRPPGRIGPLGVDVDPQVLPFRHAVLGDVTGDRGPEMPVLLSVAAEGGTEGAAHALSLDHEDRVHVPIHDLAIEFAGIEGNPWLFLPTQEREHEDGQQDQEDPE